jgi:energy-coupling factor transporter ATP-binding protein EcfA2
VGQKYLQVNMATFIYNPDRKSKAQLIAEFVVRKKQFTSIFKDLETGPMQQPEQHYLLVGQRGTGKTTLLTRLKYAVEDSPQLNTWLLPVLFAEEQYNITELANLWENIAQYLDDYAGLGNIYGEMEANLGKKDYEAICFEILAKHLDAHKKKVVLLLDNIGDLLKKFDELEIRRLREILQTKPHIRLIAASPFLLDSIIDYHQPLLEFFKVVRLEGLTKLETEELLLTLGEVFGEQEKMAAIIKEAPQRIEVMRTLSGGVPRTIALLFKVFVDDAHGTALTDLEKLLDAVTPLYKHRMDDLKPQQQKIMDAVARHWDAISVSELKKRVRMEGKIVSAQLHQLVQNQVIEKVPTNTKNHLYLLKERFFNIWYLMRYGRKDDRQRVIWLVKFLESWCSPEDLAKRIMDYTQKMKAGSLSEHYQEFYGQVYASFKNVEAEIKYQLKMTVPSNITQQVLFNEREVLAVAAQLKAQKKYEQALLFLAKQEVLSSAAEEAAFNLSTDFAGYDPAQYFDFAAKVGANENTVNQLEDNPCFYNLTFLACTGIVTNTTAILYGTAKENEVIKTVERIVSLLNIKVLRFGTKPLTELLYVLVASLLTVKKYETAAFIFEKVTAVSLAELIKPMYFAVIYFTKGEKSQEYLQMGWEIREAVEDFVKLIIKYQKD